MLVITLSRCPNKLRGDLTKWLQEIDTGVYVGNVNARVREELWLRIKQNVRNGRVTMVYSAHNAQGYCIQTLNTKWTPVDYDGIALMRHPTKVSEPAKRQLTHSVEKKSAPAVVTQKIDNTRIGEKYVVIDIETTGLNCESDAVIEVAAILVENHTIRDTFCTLVNPMCDVPLEITELTGITDEMIASGAIMPDAAIAKLSEFTADTPIVFHNAKFDLGFLNIMRRQQGLPAWDNVCKDTLKLCKQYLEDLENYKLATIAKHFGISNVDSHRALEDAKVTMQIFEELNKFLGFVL